MQSIVDSAIGLLLIIVSYGIARWVCIPVTLHRFVSNNAFRSRCAYGQIMRNLVGSSSIGLVIGGFLAAGFIAYPIGYVVFGIRVPKLIFVPIMIAIYPLGWMLALKYEHSFATKCFREIAKAKRVVGTRSVSERP